MEIYLKGIVSLTSSMPNLLPRLILRGFPVAFLGVSSIYTNTIGHFEKQKKEKEYRLKFTGHCKNIYIMNYKSQS